MALPGYAATASLYPTNRSYRGARSGPVGATGPTVIAQQSPCDIPTGGGGGGGGPRPPRRCPPGRKCCEPDPRGGCLLCVPNNALCP
jgi:hypothetical protein